jgi:predicted nucleic acid-binding protein
MSDKFFLDTNILVYTFDRGNLRKRNRAEDLVRGALEGGGIISSQVVQEFLSLALGKFEVAMSGEDVRKQLAYVLEPLCGVYSGPALYWEAISIREETGFHFYDCLILAAAVEGGCGIVYSEDMHHGRRVRGVEIRNPFV